MTRFVLLTAIILSTIPLRAESQICKRTDDSRKVYATHRAQQSDAQSVEGKHGVVAGVDSLKAGFQREEIESIIENMQQTRKELINQIENQRQLIMQMDQDLARIIDYMQEGRPQLPAESNQPSDAPEMKPESGIASLKAKPAARKTIGVGEGWIRNEATGDTISLRQGKVSIANRSGKPIGRLTEMLTHNPGAQPSGAPVQVGNMDVTFDPSASQQTRKAFLQQPIAPKAQVKLYEAYANTPRGRFFGGTPLPEKEVAVEAISFGNVLDKKAKSHPMIINDGIVSDRKSTRHIKVLNVTEVRRGERRLALKSERNLIPQVGNEIQARTGKDQQRAGAENIAGINIERESAIREYVTPNTFKEREEKIASIL